MELIIAIGILGLFVLGISGLFFDALHQNNIIWEQLSGQHDARRAVLDISDALRKAETSSIGSYPLFSIDEYEIVFFSNIDTDNSVREKVRYWVFDQVLYQGMIHPTGTPLQYNADTEIVTILAQDVQNQEIGHPLFLYYDSTYTSTSTPLVDPDITDVRLVEISLDIERTDTVDVQPLSVETIVQIRNLKEN